MNETPQVAADVNRPAGSRWHRQGKGRGRTVTTTTAATSPQRTRGFGSRLFSALALVGLFSMLLAPAVRADDIAAVYTIDATVGGMSLVTGGNSGSVSYTVIPQGSDGKNGCNLTGNTTEVVGISSSNPSVATINASQITFASCGTVGPFAVTPLSAGSTTISLIQQSNTTAGTFNLSPAIFTVTVAPPANTAPTVSVTGVASGTSYEIGTVPAALCSVVDAEDGSSSFFATLSLITGPWAAYGLGDQTATCDYTDNGGFQATQASVAYSIVDTTEPSVVVPVSSTAEATTASGVVVFYAAATASDTVWGVLTPTCDIASGSTFPFGITTVTCSAKDGSNNIGSNSFTITVQDTTKPVLMLPGNITEEATSPSGAAVIYMASASDLGTAVGIDCLPASTSTFALGTTTVECSATDTADNTANGSFSVTVQDTTAPAISNLPSNVTVEATGPSGASATWTAPSASDLVDGSVSVSCASAGGLGADNIFPLGSTTITCSATDAAGNTASDTFTVTVQDTTKPVISNVPADVSVYATSRNGASVNYAAPTATDIVSGNVSVSCQPASGSTFAKGMTPVSCKATDASGNTADAGFNVSVLDWTVNGFYAPIDKGIHNTVKSGATVPLKFNVYAGNEVTDVAQVAISVKGITCASVNGEDPVGETTTGATSLRYDTTGGQFIYNWQTPKNKAGSCYEVTMTAADGTTASATFKLK